MLKKWLREPLLHFLLIGAALFVFYNLQTDDSGLEDGTVFNHGGQLRVPVAHSPYVQGSQATGSVGTITVTIT